MFLLKCVPPRLLVNVDRIIKEVQLENENLTDLETRERGAVKLSLDELLYADEEQLQHHIILLITACKKYNMKVNIQKAEVVKISKT